VVLVILGAIFLWLAIDLLLLVFAGILLAILLRSLALAVSEHTPVSDGWALLLVILTLLGTVVGAGFLFAPQLGREARELTDTLPDAIEELESQVRQNAFGDWVLDRVLERAALTSESGEDGGKGGATQGGGGQGTGEAAAGSKPVLKDAQDAVVQRAGSAASRLIDGLIALVIVLFTGLYLAAHPQPYIRGLLRLFPLHRRQRIGEVVYAAGYTLRWWLFGQILAMVVVGLMMGVGLAIIGVPLAFALGVLAGLFEFIPTLGPLLGLLPALLLALTQDAQSALWVLALYSVVQTFESYLLTPLVQQRVVHLPPVVTIVAQVFFAWTVGPVGLLIAVPLIAVVMVVVQMLYIEDFLGDDLEVDAEDQGRIEHAEAEPLKDDEEEEG
jgi:predicted PurR-regulated permease PerM